MKNKEIGSYHKICQIFGTIFMRSCGLYLLKILSGGGLLLLLYWTPKFCYQRGSYMSTGITLKALRNTMLLHYGDQQGDSLYSENHTKPIIILRGQSFEMLQQMIRIVTIASQRVN